MFTVADSAAGGHQGRDRRAQADIGALTAVTIYDCLRLRGKERMFARNSTGGATYHSVPCCRHSKAQHVRVMQQSTVGACMQISCKFRVPAHVEEVHPAPAIMLLPSA